MLVSRNQQVSNEHHLIKQQLDLFQLIIDQELHQVLLNIVYLVLLMKIYDEHLLKMEKSHPSMSLQYVDWLWHVKTNFIHQVNILFFTKKNNIYWLKTTGPSSYDIKTQSFKSKPDHPSANFISNTARDPIIEVNLIYFSTFFSSF
jgi:hypothetical protein